VSVEGTVIQVSQTDASPAFPPTLSLITLLCVAVWIIASLANPQTRAQFLYLVIMMVFIPVLITVAAMLIPFLKPLVSIMGKVLMLVLGLTVLGGVGLVRGVRAAANQGRGEPRDLLIEIEDRSGDSALVRFARANGDVSIAKGTHVLARGRVHGTTLLAERIDVDTALGQKSLTSSGQIGKVAGYVGLCLFGLLALSAAAALVG